MQSKPKEFAFLPIADTPVFGDSPDVHGLMLVPVIADGLFRLIGTFVNSSYPKQVEYYRKEEEQNVLFKCREVTAIHERGFLNQNKESSLSSEAKGVGTFESIRSGFAWEKRVLCGQNGLPPRKIVSIRRSESHIF